MAEKSELEVTIEGDRLVIDAGSIRLLFDEKQIDHLISVLQRGSIALAENRTAWARPYWDKMLITRRCLIFDEPSLAVYSNWDNLLDVERDRVVKYLLLRKEITGSLEREGDEIDAEGQLAAHNLPSDIGNCMGCGVDISEAIPVANHHGCNDDIGVLGRYTLCPRCGHCHLCDEKETQNDTDLSYLS